MEQFTSHWIQQRSGLMPICIQNESGASDSLRELLLSQKELLGSNREAMLWLRIGMIERPHEIVQSATNGIPAYIHGIVHRLEGDYWNASYWFRRVGDSQLVSEIAAAVTLHSNVRSFDPADFTTQVESWNRSKDSATLADLEQIATREWESLWTLL